MEIVGSVDTSQSGTIKTKTNKKRSNPLSCRDSWARQKKEEEEMRVFKEGDAF